MASISISSSNNNNNTHIPRPVSNDYNPNNLSLFPDLLEPINDMEPQNLVPPPVPEMTNATREPAICPPNCTMVVAQIRRIARFFNDRGEYLGMEYTDSAPWLLAGVPERENDGSRIGAEGNLDARTMTEIERNQEQRRNSSNVVDMNHQHSGVPLQPEEPEAGEQRENNVTCPICMAPFCEATSTKCGHVFCESCITNALKRKKQCPVCRKRLATKRDLFRIYLS